MGGYIGSKTVAVSTTGADINGDANVDGSLTVGGATTLPTADINGGTINGTVIGGTTPAAISGTTGQFGASSLDVTLKDTQAHTTTDGPALRFQGAGPNGTNYDFGFVQGLSNGVNNAGVLALGTNSAGVSTQRLRIDASGNVLVGMTTANAFALTSGGGMHFNPNSDTTIARSGAGAALIVNKTDQQGTAVQFRQGGVQVGAISSFAGADISIGTDTTGLRFYDGSNGTGGNGIFVPWNVTANSARDAQINLGSSSERFRSVYLSSQVYVGTTISNPGIGNTTVGVVVNDNNIAASRSGAASFSLNRSTTIGTVADFRYNGAGVGAISVNASNTTYLTSSDHRLKENVTPIQGAGDIVKAMRPVTYTFKSDGAWMDGFIAHELQELHPVAVVGDKDAMRDEEYEVTPAVEATFDAEGVELTPAEDAVMATRSVPLYQGVDYSKLTPILTAALQEALAKIDALTARIETLEAV
jgi:hypothetical protein